jgi:phosphorylcholine metabolism protein LicD
LAKGQSYKDISYKGFKRFLLAILRKLPKKFLMRKALKELYRYDNKSTPYVCHFMGKAFFKKGRYLSSYFNSANNAQFEKVMLQIPASADEYMKCRFGNYMILPSKEHIKLAQHACQWDTNTDFSTFTNFDRDFSDEKILV